MACISATVAVSPGRNSEGSARLKSTECENAANTEPWPSANA